MERCPFVSDGCRHYNGPKGCFVDRHHLYWPRHDYIEPVEKAFRSLPDNIVDVPRCVHDGYHMTEPPIKPDLVIMREAVNAERLRRYE